MTLKEQIHQAIDQLGEAELAQLYTHLQSLRQPSRQPEAEKRIPTLDEVLEMSASDTSSWADELIAERHAGT